jgi:hypothetical protein
MRDALKSVFAGLTRAQSDKLSFGVAYVSLVYLCCAVFLFFLFSFILRGQRVSSRRLGGILFCFILIFFWAIAFWISAVIPPNGDEPFYLLAATSALNDGDCNIADNYEMGDWKQFLPAGSTLAIWPSGRKDGKIFLEERVAFIAFVAAVYAMGKVTGVALGMALASALLVYFIFRLVRVAGFSSRTSLVAALTSAFTQPLLTMGSRIYHNVLGTLCILAAFEHLVFGQRSVARFWFCVFVMAIVPWLHMSYVVFSAALFVLLVRAYRSNARTLVFAAFLLVCDALLFFWYRQLVRSAALPLVSQYGLTPHIYRSLLALFFDQEAGILFYAPVYLCSLIGLSSAFFVDKVRRIPGLIAFLCAGYFLMQGSLPAFGGGYDTGRSLMPLVPFFALFLARAFEGSKVTRVFTFFLLAISAAYGFLLVAVPWLAVNYEVGSNPVVRFLAPGLHAQRFLPSFLEYGKEHYSVVVAVCLAAVWYGARERARFRWRQL